MTLKRNQRSREAKLYRNLYSTKEWQQLRQFILARDGYRCSAIGCGVTLVDGRTSPSSAVVNHIKPHRGNLELFWDPSNLEAVCKQCHDSDIQSREKLGYDKRIGNDGWPTDDKHPSAK